MAFRRARTSLALALLVAAASGADGQGQPGVPPQGQAAAGQAQHLGRTYPRQLQPPPPRKAPRVYVSIVSPRQSSNVFQHIGQQRGQSNAGRSGGGMGSAGGMGSGGGMGSAGGMGSGGGMGAGFPAR
jgi:hypothetical protein